MALSANAEDRAVRRNPVTYAAERPIFTHGYERITIQAIHDGHGMPTGADDHDVSRKGAALEFPVAAVGARLRQGV